MSTNDWYWVQGEVAGGLGRRSKLDHSTAPATILRLHYVFEDWFGSFVVKLAGAYIVAEPLAVELTRRGFSGISLNKVDVSEGDYFRSMPTRHMSTAARLPKFRWLQVSSRPGVDDFGINRHGYLVVSRAVVDCLHQFPLVDVDIWPAEFAERAANFGTSQPTTLLRGKPANDAVRDLHAAVQNAAARPTQNPLGQTHAYMFYPNPCCLAAPDVVIPPMQVQPPTMFLRATFLAPPDGDVIGPGPGVLVRSRVAAEIDATALTGVRFSDVTFTLPPAVAQAYPGNTLFAEAPRDFVWLQILGKPWRDDFWLHNLNTVYLTSRALEVLGRFNLHGCIAMAVAPPAT